MKKNLLCFLLAALLLTACASAPEEQTELQTTAQTETAVPTESATPTETTIPPTTVPQITAPEELSAQLEQSGITLQELESLDCRQLMTVVSDGYTATLALYNLDSYHWQRQDELSCDGYVGKNGTNPKKQEGDKCSPQGLFPILEAFYAKDAPQTGLDSFQVTEGTYWVDDPNSVYYNQRVIGAENKDWRSAERMWLNPQVYKYGFVIGYNMEHIPYAGSAIFFHISDGYTAGCVATDEASLLAYLAALSTENNPYILIY